MHVWQVVIGVGLASLVGWLALVVTLLLTRPTENVLKESLRLLPDLVRLVTRLAKDRSQPRAVRIRLGLLLAYLAFPIDLVPDFVPVLGYADDVIVILITLRSLIRLVGEAPLRRHWPGTPAGFEAVLRLTQSRSVQPDPSAALPRDGHFDRRLHPTHQPIPPAFLPPAGSPPQALWSCGMRGPADREAPFRAPAD